MKKIIYLALILQTSLLFAQEHYLISKGLHNLYFENSGRVEAIKRAKISSQTTGVVTYLGANVSESFKKGEVLVRLSSVYQKAKVKEAQYTLENARIELAEKKRKYRRVQELHRHQLAKVKDLTATKTAYFAQQKKVFLKKERLKQLKELNSYTKIVAPFDGVVEKRHVHRTEKVAINQLLYTLYNKKKIRIVVTVPESLLATIKKYKEVNVESEGNVVSIPWKNIVIFPSSYRYAYTLRLTLPKKYSSSFHDGNFVKVRFKKGEEEAMYLDANYLHKEYETTIVYLETPQGVVKHYVRVGEKRKNQVKILSGLKSGDKVVNHVE